MLTDDVLVRIAYDICVSAHYDQVDYDGKPYYLHPVEVAKRVSAPKEKIVAYLHDVLEDTEYPRDVLEQIFGLEIMEALDLVTHRQGVPYMEYVAGISRNPLAKTVKIADLTHNIERGKNHTPPNVIRRHQKHLDALEYLRSCK